MMRAASDCFSPSGNACQADTFHAVPRSLTLARGVAFIALLGGCGGTATRTVTVAERTTTTTTTTTTTVTASPTSAALRTVEVSSASTLVQRLGISYSVQLPPTWTMTETPFGANWVANVWTGGGGQQARITSSGGSCDLIVAGHLELHYLIPKGRIVEMHFFSPYRLGYEVLTPGDRLPDNGLIIATPAPNGPCLIQGTLQLDLWLPTAEHAAATAILNSWRT
jgi:hypothetical protein